MNRIGLRRVGGTALGSVAAFACLWLVVGATRAWGQEASDDPPVRAEGTREDEKPPSTTAEEGPDSLKDLAAKAGRRQQSRWTLTATAQPLWETNPRFAPAPEAAEAGSRLRVDLGRTIDKARLEIVARGNASAARYQTSTELNRWTYGFDGGLNYLFSRRTSLRLTQTVLSDFAQNIRQLAGSGLLFEQVLTRSYLSNAEIQRRLTRRLTGTTTVRYDRYAFAANSQGLSDGATFSAQARLAQALGRHDSLSFSYEYQAQRAGSTTGIGNDLRLGFKHQLTGRLESTVSAGAGFSRPLGVVDWTPTWVGAASLRLRAGSQTLSGSFNRGVGQAFGLGSTNVSTGYSISDDIGLSRRVRASLMATETRSAPLNGVGADYDSRNAMATLLVTVTRQVTANLGYTFYQLSSNGKDITNHQLALSLALNTTWR